MLKSSGFIVEDMITSQDGSLLFKAYVLTEYSRHIQYIPVQTLQKLVDTTNQNVIKVYAYLLGWYGHKAAGFTAAAIAGKRGPGYFIFTKKQLIQHCLGMSSTTHQRDYDAINNILDCLVLFGLIQYENIICNSPNDHQHVRMKLKKVNKFIKEVNIKTVAK